MIHAGQIGAILYAKNLPRLVDFYAAVTSLQVQTIEQSFAILGQQPSQLVIVRIPERIARSTAIETPPVRREEVPIKLVFAVADIFVARNRAAERGGAVDPIDREWEFEGMKVCDGYDPEGNIFQLRFLN
jgi:predicted enzyme related to lactoylglutathione lyase